MTAATDSPLKQHPLRLFKGVVSHRRTEPSEHAFRYNIQQVWVDLRQLDAIDQISPFWSTSRANLVRFSRKNYLPDEQCLYDTACQTILRQSGKSFSGDIYLLANLSYWGTCFNPVVFLFCYDGDELKYLIAEVHSTPWNERFCYVHDLSEQTPQQGKWHTATFDKAMHVSPFMPMALTYEWQYSIDDNQFLISMNLIEENQSIFNATMNLKGEPLTTSAANWLPFKYPFMCFAVVTRIYWQAFKLWLKRVPFHSHPEKQP